MLQKVGQHQGLHCLQRQRQNLDRIFFKIITSETKALYTCIHWITGNLKLTYSKTCLKQPLKKKTKLGFQDRLSLNAGQKYCRMLQGEHSAILWTFIKLPFVIYIFVLSFFE